jgi:hypothetical protein
MLLCTPIGGFLISAAPPLMCSNSEKVDESTQFYYLLLLTVKKEKLSLEKEKKKTMHSLISRLSLPYIVIKSRARVFIFETASHINECCSSSCCFSFGRCRLNKDVTHRQMFGKLRVTTASHYSN